MELNNYGFVEAGNWKLKERVKSGVTFELYNFKEERVAYAFVIDDEVKYIGVCDNTGLHPLDWTQKVRRIWHGWVF